MRDQTSKFTHCLCYLEIPVSKPTRTERCKFVAGVCAEGATLTREMRTQC